MKLGRLGWHVAKHGNRYAEALAVAVNSVFGSARSDVARGVLLRHNRCSAFMSAHFQNQLYAEGRPLVGAHFETIE